MDELRFEEITPLGFSVRVSLQYWEVIATIKHPSIAGHEQAVREALRDPDEIRVSKGDPFVFLFYKSEREKRWVCAVSKRLNGTGFLITAYLTDAIKTGELVWKK